MDDSELNSILKKRAERLAHTNKERLDSAEGTLELVEFLLSGERYALESSYIREVHPLNELTHIPCTPPFVAGIVNIRRKIISVVDLKKLFDLPETKEILHCKILVLEKGKMEFAIVADSVVGVSTLKTERIQGALPTMTGIRQELLKGITTDRLIILDGDKLLGSQLLVVNEILD